MAYAFYRLGVWKRPTLRPTQMPQWPDSATRSGGELVLDLWWYGKEVPANDVTVFVHVVDQAGQLVAQGDGYPLLGLFPPLRWQPGDLVHDVRYIALPNDFVEEPYTIVVGWYDTAIGTRLPAFDGQGQPVADDAIQIFPP
jgi:hypothetical protein